MKSSLSTHMSNPSKHRLDLGFTKRTEAKTVHKKTQNQMFAYEWLQTSELHCGAMLSSLPLLGWLVHGGEHWVSQTSAGKAAGTDKSPGGKLSTPNSFHLLL